MEYSARLDKLNLQSLEYLMADLILTHKIIFARLISILFIFG